MQIWNRSDEYCWRYRADTILSTDGQTDKVIPVYPPINFVEAGGITKEYFVTLMNNRTDPLPSSFDKTPVGILLQIMYNHLNFNAIKSIIAIIWFGGQCAISNTDNHIIGSYQHKNMGFSIFTTNFTVIISMALQQKYTPELCDKSDNSIFMCWNKIGEGLRKICRDSGHHFSISKHNSNVSCFAY